MQRGKILEPQLTWSVEETIAQISSVRGHELVAIIFANVAVIQWAWAPNGGHDTGYISTSQHNHDSTRRKITEADGWRIFGMKSTN